MSALELTAVVPEDRDALVNMWVKCFTGKVRDERWGDFLDLIGLEHVRALRRDGEIVAALVLYDMGQFFGGRSVRMGGYAAVGVPAHERGKGVATDFMVRTLRELRDDGVPLSALYASTQTLYRGVGFEQAGAAYRYTIPVDAVRMRDSDLEVRPAEVDASNPVVRDLYRRRALRSNGHVDRNDTMWARVFRFVNDRPISVYVAGPADAPEGYVVFSHLSEPALFVRDFVALTPRAARRLWTVLGSHGTIYKTIHWAGPAVDPLLCHLPEQRASLEKPERWMLRIVDVPKALAQRGYATDVRAELHLEVTDPLLPENAGRFTLSVDGGEAGVERGGEGALRLDVRALAPLYSGLLSPTELRDVGWLEGASDALDAATRIFAGPQPWMPDHF